MQNDDVLNGFNEAHRGLGLRRDMAPSPAVADYAGDQFAKAKKPRKPKVDAKTTAIRDGSASAVTVIQLGDGPRTYALQVSPLQYVKINPATQPEEAALLKLLRPDLEDLENRKAYDFHPTCPVTYQSVDYTIDGHASWRYKLLTVTPVPQTTPEPPDLPPWCKTEDDLTEWLANKPEQTAEFVPGLPDKFPTALPAAKEVLGPSPSQWPAKEVAEKMLADKWVEIMALGKKSAELLKARDLELEAKKPKPSTVVDNPPEDDKAVWSAQKPETPDFKQADLARLHFKNELAKIGPDLNVAWQEKLAVSPHAGIQVSIDAVGLDATVESLEARLRYLRMVPPTARDEYIPPVQEQEETMADKKPVPPTKEEWITLRDENSLTSTDMANALSIATLTMTELTAFAGKDSAAAALKRAQVKIDTFKEKQAAASSEADAFNEMMSEAGAEVSEPPEEDEPDGEPEPPKPAAKPKADIKLAEPDKLARVETGVVVATLTGINAVDIQKALDKPLHPAAYAEMTFGKNKGEAYIKRVEFLRDRMDQVFGPCGIGWSMLPHATLGNVENTVEERAKDGKTQTWYVTRMINWTFRYAVIVNGTLTWVETTVTSAESDNMDRTYAQKGAETTLLKRFYRLMGGQNHLVYHRYTYAQAQHDLAELQKKRAA